MDSLEIKISESNRQTNHGNQGHHEIETRSITFIIRLEDFHADNPSDYRTSDWNTLRSSKEKDEEELTEYGDGY